ncbi:MAG: CheR family methyltransferase [Planctomycetota bacterium]|jgi:chemotaxis protein methyltransferase CheR
MDDQECVRFLQWALPRLRMRWPGFRKVRRQVSRRIDRRLRELELADVTAYRTYLQDRAPDHDDEWQILDSFCRITISRFYRDRGLFDQLADVVLPKLAERAVASGQPGLRCWSAGCASGEEVYTLRILWNLRLQPQHRQVGLHVLGTDADSFVLERARVGLFPRSSLNELPSEWLALAFDREGTQYRLRDRYRDGVELELADIRRSMPDQTFDLIVCRNLVFTYFEETQQQEILTQIAKRLRPGGALFIGVHEQLPAGAKRFSPWRNCRAVFRREE